MGQYFFNKPSPPLKQEPCFIRHHNTQFPPILSLIVMENHQRWHFPQRDRPQTPYIQIYDPQLNRDVQNKIRCCTYPG